MAAKVLGITVLVLVLVLSACGGSDDESGDTTAPTTPATITNGGSSDGRLSEASWTEYQTALASAQTVNAAATKTFAKCADLDFTSISSQQLKACLGNSTTAVVTEGQKFMDTLTGFESEVSGNCATQLTTLEGYVKLYVGSVDALGRSLEGTVGVGAQQDLQNAQQVLADARSKREPFEDACEPA
jgi:hypothetical protein